jgi:hypothetical protein
MYALGDTTAPSTEACPRKIQILLEKWAAAEVCGGAKALPASDRNSARSGG